MAENPSADKFGPPPEQAARERERLGSGLKRGVPWSLGFFAAYVGLKIVARTSHGWTAGLFGLLALMAAAGQYIANRKQQDARGKGPDPYSPPTQLTR